MSPPRPARGPGDAGFTLMELLVVMIIIGVLAAIAIPAFLSQRNKAWDTVTKSNLHRASLAMVSQWQFSDPTGFTSDAPTMRALEPSVNWVSSNGISAAATGDQVAFEFAQGGSGSTAMMSGTSKSGRCFYLRIVEDDSMAPTGVSYLSQGGPCVDPWDRSSQTVNSTW